MKNTSKYTFSLRIKNKAIYDELEIIAKKKGYASINKFLNDIIEETVKSEKKLPEIFYKTKKVDSYIKFNREELHDRH